MHCCCVLTVDLKHFALLIFALKIFGPQSNRLIQDCTTIEDCAKLQNEKLHDLYSSKNIPPPVHAILPLVSITYDVLITNFMLLVPCILILSYNVDQQYAPLCNLIEPFKSRIHSHLPFPGIIRSSPYSPRQQDKGLFFTIFGLQDCLYPCKTIL